MKVFFSKIAATSKVQSDMTRRAFGQIGDLIQEQQRQSAKRSSSAPQQ
jgi:hypothetical protein